MRRRYLVAYDVADAKRLKKTHRTMHGFGDPLQYSLFLCALSAIEKQLVGCPLPASEVARAESIRRRVAMFWRAGTSDARSIGISVR